MRVLPGLDDGAGLTLGCVPGFKRLGPRGFPMGTHDREQFLTPGMDVAFTSGLVQG